MSFVFLDAAYPQSVDAMDQAMKRAGAQGFACYIGGNNVLNIWPDSIIQGLIARGYQGMTIWVPWPPTANGAADGAAAAAKTKRLGLKLAALDIEANAVSQGATRGYCQAWLAGAQGVIRVGYSNASGISTDLFNYDRAWCYTKGLADACNMAHCPGSVGSRATQCGGGSFAGVSCDVTVSEYDFGTAVADPPPPPPPPPNITGSSLEKTMITFEYNGALHSCWVDDSGVLQHRDYGLQTGWAVEQVMSGLAPHTGIGYDIGFNGALHLFALGADAKLRHAYYTIAGGWGTESVS